MKRVSYNDDVLISANDVYSFHYNRLIGVILEFSNTKIDTILVTRPSYRRCCHL